jgi:hypothetical protein
MSDVVPDSEVTFSRGHREAAITICANGFSGNRLAATQRSDSAIWIGCCSGATLLP